MYRQLTSGLKVTGQWFLTDTLKSLHSKEHLTDRSQDVGNGRRKSGADRFFYGPFGDVTLDLNKVTTSLEYNGNKLPDGATLVQTGNTVKYVNVSSPVGYTYQIFIPATVNYGWGTTSSTLTITVNPNN